MKTIKKSSLFFFMIFYVVATAWAAPTALPDWSTLFEENKKAIVSISVEGTEKVQMRSPFHGSPFHDFPFGEFSPFGGEDPFEFFFGKPQAPQERERPIRGMGSGFVIDADEGIIVTNAHVINQADEITVYFYDNHEVKATLIGQDKRSDVAILQVETDDKYPLQAVNIANVDTLKVGQWVMAVGSPFGLDYTATQGIISSLGRNLPNDNYTPFIQTDAAINPGNSGGPLFNTEGEVIGINSQIYTRTGSYAGVGFAIPIDIVMEVVEQIQTHGKVTRGWLGVQIQAVTPALAESFAMKKAEGALIASVVEDSPAAKAGIKVGDIILYFNDKKVTSSSQLPMLVARAKIGEKATVVVLRDGKEKAITVVIEASEADLLLGGLEEGQGSNSLKITVENQSDSKEKGVVVTQVEAGLAMSAGIQRGDIILQINNYPTNTVKLFNKALKESDKAKVIRLLVEREGNPFYLAITKP